MKSNLEPNFEQTNPMLFLCLMMEFEEIDLIQSVFDSRSAIVGLKTGLKKKVWLNIERITVNNFITIRID